MPPVPKSISTAAWLFCISVSRAPVGELPSAFRNTALISPHLRMAWGGLLDVTWHRSIA